MQSPRATDPRRHLLEHGAIVIALALLSIWWWWAAKGDGFRQFGGYAGPARIIDYAADGIGFPTLMIMTTDRPTGTVGLLLQCLSYVLAALFWMHGPVWLAMAIGGQARRRFLQSLGSGNAGRQQDQSFGNRMPDYLFAGAVSALWGSYKYSQLVAVTGDEALRFLFLCALPATALPLAIMILRRWVVDCWRRLRPSAA